MRLRTHVLDRLTLFFLFAFTSLSVQAAMPVPAPPEVAAKNYILMDYVSGNVLAEKNADEQIEPASITKMMSVYVVDKELTEGRLSLDDKVTISEKAWRMGGSRMYVDVNSKVPVKDLLKGIIIQSGNDATVALAEHVAGTEDAFVQLMNQYATDLGMNNTHFVNSTGWPDPNHLTTARDIAKLARAIIKEFPERYSIYKEKEYTYNNIRQYNRNKLLWRDASVDGIKTGHTESAGYCLVASAMRSDMRLISVALGTDSEKARADVSQALLNYGFRFYEAHALYDKGDVLSSPRVWMGNVENLPVGLNEDLAVTIPRGSYEKLDATMDIDKNIEAPINVGQQVGVVNVTLNGEKLSSMPLVALKPVERGNLLQVAKDYLLKLIN